MKFVAALLAGGSGERFWPWSRQAHPKQFLKLDGQTSLLEATWQRLQAICPPEQRFIVTQQSQKELIQTHLPELKAHQLLLEPCARDTAAAVLLTTLQAHKQFGDVVMGIFPSDHHIGKQSLFEEAIHLAIAQAAQGGIVTFGIVPMYAATGYGYIDYSLERNHSSPNLAVHDVKRFVEKPNVLRAESMLNAGHFLWNAGMFFFRTTVMLELFQALQPELYAALAENFESENLPTIYNQLNKISLDYAIMEMAPDVKVIPVDFEWDDLGDWSALRRLNHTDNVSIGEHLSLETHGSIVVNQTSNLVVTLGIENVVVVKCDDVTLVMPKNRCQEVKQVLQALRAHASYGGLV
jgi:mannose-1-phosphate guanylyltransferase